jgi:hypothetical protein
MKRNTILIALFVASFMFPSIGSVNTADALGAYGCQTKDSNGTITCLRGKLDGTAFGKRQPDGTHGSKDYKCGNSNTKTETMDRINCLRALLDTYAPHLALGKKAYDDSYDDKLMHVDKYKDNWINNNVRGDDNAPH